MANKNEMTRGKQYKFFIGGFTGSWAGYKRSLNIYVNGILMFENAPEDAMINITLTSTEDVVTFVKRWASIADAVDLMRWQPTLNDAAEAYLVQWYKDGRPNEKIYPCNIIRDEEGNFRCLQRRAPQER